MNIKERILISGFRQWEIAEVMGVSEFTLSRYLRRPDRMDPQVEKRIEKAMDELRAGEGVKNDKKNGCAK
ncbi:MAG: LacI family DNA-binding transcriptional regulator [Syntrophomonadaceae bacterium]|jgi:predicted transcriptional regulator|nr:LacI family DNA-binding transcriptional regulator [Syntrophomonadaceae bacterium]NLN84454.1 LacI family DNA-binding transcriptional regulator [Bacillota bacterium]